MQYHGDPLTASFLQLCFTKQTSRWYRVSIVLVICLNAMVTSFANAEEEATTYGGYTLNEWKLLIKSNSLEELGSPRAVLGLLEIVTDRSVVAISRRQAALTLGRIGEPAVMAVPAFRSVLQLERNSHESQLWALKALALLGERAENATEDVAAIVLDPDRPLLERMQAVETLGRIGARKKLAVTTLIEMLRTTEGAAELKELRMVVANGLWHLEMAASPALPELIRAAQDPWALTRLAAVQSIGNIGPLAEIAIPTLVDVILFDDAGEVQEAAADALGKIGELAIPALQQLSEDRDLGVRRLALRGLTLIVSPQSNVILTRSLEDADLIVAAEASRSLLRRNIRIDEAMKTLIRVLEQGDREASITAYRTLQTETEHLAPYQNKLIQLKSTETTYASQAAEKLLLLMGDDSRIQN